MRVGRTDEGVLCMVTVIAGRVVAQRAGLPGFGAEFRRFCADAGAGPHFGHTGRPNSGRSVTAFQVVFTML